MATIRKPAVAGVFYSADPRVLEREVSALLRSAQQDRKIPKALIVPHAGYIYSGSTAAEAYAPLHQVAEEITRVALLGPSHRVPLHGLAVPSVDYFATPLGMIPLDKKALSHMRSLPQVKVSDEAHEQEHSLEVHLPFLQNVLKKFRLVPVVVGVARPEEVSEALELVWGGPETLIVISSDLSHYLDYQSAKNQDAITSQAILSRSLAITPEMACGAYPIRGLLHAAASHGLEGKLIHLCNSGDTAGPRNRVVGYGAYYFGPRA